MFVAVDVAAVSVASVVAHLLRFGWSHALLPGPDIPYVLIAIVSVPAWLVVIALAGGYDPRTLGVGSEEYRRVLDGGVHFLALVALLHFVFRLVFARGWVGVMIPVAVTLTLAVRYLLRMWLYRQRTQGRYAHRMLLVGSTPTVMDVGHHLQRASWSGLRVVGVCVDDGNGHVTAPGSQAELSHLVLDDIPVPILGTVADLGDAIAATGADSVAVTDESASATLAGLVATGSGPGVVGANGSSVELLVAPALAEVAGPRMVVRPAAGLPLLHVEAPTFAGPQRVLKNTFDRLGAAVGLLLLWPLFLVTAVLIRLDSPGPVFFRQVRVGRDGRTFGMVKFRTMVVNAEELRSQLAEDDDGSGLLFKLHRDPRVTRVGQVLRRWSFDELPQLWNVLRGDMSLVGPRPPLPTEVERYGRDVSRRLLVKPGMTGLWQVSGRSNLAWDESVRLDLYYVDHWSPIMDATIILRTFTAVARGEGAY